MSYRRRHRWFRRMALGLAFTVAMLAGRTSVAAAKFDEGTSGSRYVTAGGWSGLVDPETGVPLSAGIPRGDEQFIDTESVQVVPYLSHGMLTEADAQAAAAESVQVVPYLSHGLLTEADAQAAAAKAIHDPFLTDIFVRPGEGVGRPDGDSIAIANAMRSQQQPTVTPYVSQGVLGEAVKSQEVAAARPDDLSNRFAHSDVAPRPELASTGSTVEWNEALTVGIGALVLMLGLGLAVGYLRRPRIAGL